MEQIIIDLVDFFGLNYTPIDFIDLVVWFVKMSFACSLFRYALYSMFWCVGQFNKRG